MNEIARNIKRIRSLSGFTQEMLAERMFVTRQTISNWETGKSRPDIDTLISIADTLEVEVTELIYGKKSSYQRFQKKYIIAAGISLMVIIIATILELTLHPFLTKLLQLSFKGSFELSVYEYSVEPVVLLAIGILIISVLSFWIDIRMAKTARIILRVSGFILLVLSFWLLLENILIYKAPQLFPGQILFAQAYSSNYIRMLFLIVFPLLSGIGLFLGFNRKS
jgi:transcriptional regulator with XRE-family HTH domain